MKQKVKVLILCPHPSGKGGVAYYYRLFEKYFHSEKTSIEFLYTGKRLGQGGWIVKTIRDIVSLLKICGDKDVIVVNPSLDTKAVLRDGIFHFFAKVIFKKSTIIFFHGWDSGFARMIDRYLKFGFKRVFNGDKVIVLASQFKKELVKWGFDETRVELETTVFESHSFNSKKDPLRLVFLSRFAEGKGCLEAIQTIEILKNKYEKIKLYMVGDGELRARLEEYVHEKELDTTVEFTGWLDGELKYQLLDQCGIMLYPTNYGEGLPICLLEGMGMGLAIVSRPVAGIPDIFENNKNGFLVETLNPKDFSNKVELLIEDEGLFANICKNNKEEALQKFEIKKVVSRIDKIYFEASQAT